MPKHANLFNLTETNNNKRRNVIHQILQDPHDQHENKQVLELKHTCMSKRIVKVS